MSAADAAAAPANDAAPASVMFSTDAPQIIEHVNKPLAFTPSDVRWIPTSPRFVAVGVHPKGTGAVSVYEMAPDGLRLVADVVRPQGVKCGTFGASFLEDRHFAVGDYRGALSILDLSRAGAPGAGAGAAGAAPAAGAVVWEAPAAHASIVNAIDGCGGLNVGGGAPEIVTGGRDGAVRLWDPRQPGVVLALEPAEGQTARECWTVAFGNASSDEERCIVAGYDNGDVKLFDLRTQTMRWETNVGNGVTSVEFDRKDIEMNKLAATMLESKFRLFDMRTQHPVEGFARLEERCHKSTVWLSRHLPQNRDVWLTTGGNGGVNVYRYAYAATRSERDAEGRPRGRMGKIELLNSRIVSTQPVIGVRGRGGDARGGGGGGARQRTARSAAA
jgi:hypothetical protein